MDPTTLRFTKTHEWCHVENDVVTLGITEHSAKGMGHIVYVELPDPEDDVLTDEPWGEIESLAKVRDLHSPVDGRILSVNLRLVDDPDPIVGDPYGDGWIVKLKANVPPKVEDLLTYEQYQALTQKS